MSGFGVSDSSYEHVYKMTSIGLNIHSDVLCEIGGWKGGAREKPERLLERNEIDNEKAKEGAVARPL